MKAMPKDIPAHLAAPKRAPSPHNKQPVRRREESPTARFMPQAMDDVVTPEPAAALPRKAPPPLPPHSDEDSHPTPRKAPPAYLNTTAPVQSRTPTPSQTSATTAPAKAPPPPLAQDDHDLWNDFLRQRTDPIVELVTPAVALARSSSPPRVHNIEPQLPSILQAPQYPCTSYSVWDDTWHAPPSPTPQQFPPAAWPPLHPAPLSQPAPILRPLAPAAPSQQHSIFTEGRRVQQHAPHSGHDTVLSGPRTHTT